MLRRRARAGQPMRDGRVLVPIALEASPRGARRHQPPGAVETVGDAHGFRCLDGDEARIAPAQQQPATAAIAHFAEPAGPVAQAQPVAAGGRDARQPAPAVEVEATPVRPAPLPAPAGKGEHHAVGGTRRDEAARARMLEADAPAVGLEHLHAGLPATAKGEPGVEAVAPPRAQAAILGAADEVAAEHEGQARLQGQHASEVAPCPRQTGDIGQRDVHPPLVLGARCEIDRIADAERGAIGRQAGGLRQGAGVDRPRAAGRAVGGRAGLREQRGRQGNGQDEDRGEQHPCAADPTPPRARPR